MKRGRRLALLPLLFFLGACGGLRPASLPFLAKPAWERPPPPVLDRPVVDATRLHRSVLPNGLVVLILEDRRLPSVDLGVTVRRGAGIVPLEKAGLANFTAELMGRGAGERRALELAGVVEELGASLSVGASWDSMTATVGGLSRDLDPLFEVLADVTLRPRFDADEAERVRAEQLAALEKAREDPKQLASWRFASALYPGHIYGTPGLGTPESVAGLDAEEARAFHAKVFVPSNAIFFAVGDVDAEDLRARIEGAYGSWRGSPPPPPGPPPPESRERRVVVVDRPDLGQAQVLIGHPGIRRTEPRRLAVQVMDTVLGSAGFSSRLMSTIRAQEGLTYGIWSQFAGRRQPGPYVVASFTRVPEVGRLVELTLAELARIRTEPPSETELAAAKTLLVGRFALGLETSAAVLSGLVDLDVEGLPPDSLDTYRGRIRALRREEVSAAARDFVHPEQALIVVVGPAEKVAPQLERFGPVRIVQP